jgi:hypothetical protein
VEQRLASGIERLYRAIADKRLALDPALDGRSRAEVVKSLALAYAPELATGSMSMERIKVMANSIQTKGQVYSPAFFGRIFTPEVAQVLNKEFAAEQSSLRKSIADANSMLKALELGFDFGVGQIQLLPTLYNNPRIWGQANYLGLKSMFFPETLGEYVRKNEPYIRELNQMGASVGNLQEMMVGLAKGQPITRVPVLGEMAMAFGRQFQSALE